PLSHGQRLRPFASREAAGMEITGARKARLHTASIRVIERLTFSLILLRLCTSPGKRAKTRRSRFPFGTAAETISDRRKMTFSKLVCQDGNSRIICTPTRRNETVHPDHRIQRSNIYSDDRV